MLKKILYIIVLITCSFSLMPNILAFGTSLSSKTSILSNEEFTVTFSVTNATNLMGIQAKLNYDSNKLSYVSHSGLNDYVVTVGTNIVADRATGRSGSFGFATVKFKAKSGFAIGENTTISLSSVTGSDGSDISGTGSSIKINMVAPKSTNNNLRTLTINGTQISGFSASKTNYNVTVENSMSSIIIGATAADSKASVSGTGSKNLKVYQNSFNIVVTAESGSRKTYTVNVTRKDSNGRTTPADTNNKLETLTIKDLDIEFVNNIYQYDLEVSNEFIFLEIIAASESSKATVDIDAPNSLIIGLNKITITVTAEDTSQQVYTINITRKDNVPTLTVEEIFELIDSIESDVINIDIYDDSFILDLELYALLIEHNKDITISFYKDNNLSYKWYFKSGIEESNALINAKISFKSDFIDQINKLTNYAHKIFLHFDHNGPFPTGTSISVFVGDEYEDDTLLYLYYFNLTTEEIELIHQNLKVENGFVEFDIEHASDYFLSRADLITPATSLLERFLTQIICIIIIVVQSVFLFKLIKEKKKD